MRKVICTGGVILLVLSIVTQAAIVKKVEIVQAVGSTAYNSAGAGTLTWSVGTSGSIMLDDWSYFEFENADVQAIFSGVNDLSSGGIAKATFSSGSWTVDLSEGAMSVHIAGTIVGVYREEEVIPSDSLALDGRAIVHIDQAVFTGFSELNLQWGNENMLGGIMASILFPPDYPDITDYQSDYLSDNVTVTLLADESAIPEPMTMLLLGLGAVLLRKK